MSTPSAGPTVAEVEAEVTAWIERTWDPDMTVGQWWQALADERYANPMLPEAAGGRAWGKDLATAVLRALADHDLVGPPAGLGMSLAAPTIAMHGSPEQIARFVPQILNGQEAWCQLFSEPGAGSDLAGLQCKAEQDGEEWIVNGQKVWTSGGHVSDLGMLIARTDPDQPKHQGITYFGIPMAQVGVDVRPLREMTGRALFNEVFLTDARVADENRIGARGEGWKIANTTLMFERAHLGAGTVSIATVQAGQVAGNLDRRVGDFARKRSNSEGVPPVGIDFFWHVVDMARKLGRSDDPIVRQRLVTLYSLIETNRMTLLRAKAGGAKTGVEPNLGKLAVSEMFRQFREVGNLVIGADGLLLERDSATGGVIQEVTMFSPGPSIYGGSDQIQRNIIGERGLGLPKEPGPAKDTPFRDLLKN
jgi:alkylation response protein AidB-like acyl-CoA dehydrogenase